MKNYLKHDEWCIIEEGFHAQYNKISESIFSLGNGKMGHRANFEEGYSAESLQGNYIAGVYYPDKTRVGWWKNGYPEYFAKVLNAANWLGIGVEIGEQKFDLAKCQVENFTRTLNMKEGWLSRSLKATLANNKQLSLQTKRFLSIADDESGVIQYQITPLNFSGKINFRLFIDADVKNEDANYDEKFWDEVNKEVIETEGYITAATQKTNFHVCTGMKYHVFVKDVMISPNTKIVTREKYIESSFLLEAAQNQVITIIKFGVNISSQNYPKKQLVYRAKQVMAKVYQKGWSQMLKEQQEAWANKWQESDITISGDIAAQQGIRFNIFQLYQTYTGKDERLNIGPKGFTGEKYGGATYWDTEAYCLPFYLSTADKTTARSLLIYRYKHLSAAIANARKLGFHSGAALYPMVTMNGEECHNEWEITFEEIHRNAAIAFAIYHYINYVGDWGYLSEYGLEVLIGITRFWVQRVNFSEAKKQYVILGVTGPNEYENNVNNNWYTNLMARWCMQYTQQAVQYVQKNDKNKYNILVEKLAFNSEKETSQWKHIINNMYLPEDKEKGIFLQQEDYLDKEQQMADELSDAERPISQNWSWDRILRSCFIKQADVLQGIYFLESQFDLDTIRRNFYFYEPRTVHESSLSPCIHAVIAAKIGDREKAYEMYLRTSRLDLDDYNNDTEDGCHITSMAGSWMSIVQGFGGMCIEKNRLSFRPFIPKKWNGYAFKIVFQEALLRVRVNKKWIYITNESLQTAAISLYGKVIDLAGKKHIRMGVE